MLAFQIGPLTGYFALVGFTLSSPVYIILSPPDASLFFFFAGNTPKLCNMDLTIASSLFHLSYPSVPTSYLC